MMKLHQIIVMFYQIHCFIRRVYNIFRTHNITNQISSGSLGFRIKSGRFDLSAISITPFVDQNFNPGFTNVSVPMPVNDEAQVRYDFLAEFYDFNNNKSIQLAETFRYCLKAQEKLSR